MTTRKAGETFETDLSARQAPEQVQAMLARLEADPAIHDDLTKALVTEVAALAESGTLRTAATLYALGVLRTSQRQFESAEVAYRDAIAMAPEWSWPYSGLGILLANHTKGRLDEAEEAFRTAILLDPEWSRPHNDLAILLRISGRFDQAEREAIVALELDPDNVANRNNYGNLLVKQHRYEEAEPQYRRATELAPDHPKPYYNLACLHSLQGRASEAVPLLARAIELSPALRQEAAKDPDLDAIREDPAFEELMADQEEEEAGVAP